MHARPLGAALPPGGSPSDDGSGIRQGPGSGQGRSLNFESGGHGGGRSTIGRRSRRWLRPHIAQLLSDVVRAPFAASARPTSAWDHEWWREPWASTSKARMTRCHCNCRPHRCVDWTWTAVQTALIRRCHPGDDPQRGILAVVQPTGASGMGRGLPEVAPHASLFDGLDGK